MDRAAYGLALAAIGLWSGLAAGVSALHARHPRQQLLAVGLSLLIGGLLAAPRWREWKVSYLTRLVGVGGILGYHLLYFAAFALAPAVEVNLINYLWPLLIVLLAPLITGDALHARHLFAGCLGLLGCSLICFADGKLSGSGHVWGYACAGLAALTWALYSLLTRRLPPFPTAAVGGFCVVSGAGALVTALVWSGADLVPTLAAYHWWQWLVIVAMGLGPLGAAFFCWDAALKRGDPRIIGTLAYLTPLLSTLWLCLFQWTRPGWPVLVALVLIVGGAAVGSWPTRSDRSTRRTTRMRR